MPTVLTLTPTGTISNTFGAPVGGTADAVVADSSVANYLPSDFGQQDLAEFNVTDVTLPAGNRVGRIRARLEYISTIPSGGGYVQVSYRVGSGPSTVLVDSAGTSGNPASFFSPYYEVNLSDADTDALVMSIYQYGGNAVSSEPKITYAYLEVTHYAPPVTSAVVGAALADTGRPVATWTFAGDGLEQAWYQVAIYTPAQYGAGGFVPFVGPAVHDSGIVSHWNNLWQGIGVTLQDGDYRFYVRTAQAVGGLPHWSDPAFDDYTFDRFPNVPTLASPAPGTVIDLGAGFIAAWHYSHRSLGVAQGAWALRRKTTGAYSYWRESDLTWQASVQWNTGTATSKAFAAGAWANGIGYLWSVAVQDADGDQSAFAPDWSITGNARPVVSALSPATLSSVTATTRPIVSWTYTDAEGDPQEQYEAKVVDDAVANASSPDGGAVATWTSGIASGTATSRTLDVDLINGHGYWLHVRAYSAGQWSAWVSTHWSVLLDVTQAPDVSPTLLIHDGDNMLTENQASLETAVTGWAAHFACTVARSTLFSTDGAASLELTATGTSGMTAITPRGAFTTIPNIVPGTTYTFRADVKAGTTGRNIRPAISWYTASGTPISDSLGSSVADINSAFTPCFVTAVAPANAARASCTVDVLTTTVVGEKHYLDRLSLHRGVGTGWSLPPTNPTVADMTVLGGVVLEVLGHVNWLTTNQADLEVDTTGWANHFGSTVARSTLHFMHGVASLELTATGTSGMTAITPRGASTSMPGIIPGLTYTFRADVKAGTTARNTQATISWWKADGTFISNTSGTVVADVNTGFTTIYATGIAPLLAARASCTVDVLTTTVVGEKHYFDQFSFHRGTSITWSRGGFTPGVGARFDLERSDDGGATWAYVRGARDVFADVEETFTVTDYEATPRSGAQYRARTKTLLPGTTDVWLASAPSASVVATPEPDRVWIKDPLDPARNAVFTVSPGVKLRHPILSGTYYPKGRTTAVVVSESAKRGAEFTFPVRVLSREEGEALEQLAIPGRTLLVQDPIGQQWFARLVDGIDTEFLRASDPDAPRRWAFDVSLKLVEVSAPAVT